MANILPKLKPLLLPQLVEERRRCKEKQGINLSQTTITAVNNGDGTITTSVYLPPGSACSDIATPLTPTFSARGHSRYGSTGSSIDLSSTTPCESPCSPQTLPTPAKRALPDVQEEPAERDGESSVLPDDDFYYCLCDGVCVHGDDAANFDLDYDLGCLSDGNFSDRYSARKSHESTFSGIAARLGSRFNNITMWRSGKRPSLMSSPTYELTFENAYPMSLAASSRSSSLSSPSYNIFDRSPDQPVTATPEISFWESTDSIGSPTTTGVGMEKSNSVRVSIERDRALATTPLLPPLMRAPPQDDEAQSPLELPPVAPQHDIHSPAHSTRPSISSLEHSPASMHSMLPECDEWSDRLGHANFTIFPEPYHPALVDRETVRKFLEDWAAARTSYTQHLYRTGEHYGQTGKIYALTEAKWAEIEHEWKMNHDSLMEYARATGRHEHSPSISSSRSHSRGRSRSRANSSSRFARKSCDDDLFAGMEWRRVEEDLPTTISKMLDAKIFPSLGDNGIVGPMERDEVMVRSTSEDRKRSKFWRSLVGKVLK